MLRILTLIALIAAPSVSTPAPLQPTGKWHLYYQESNCAAERTFGDFTIGFQPSPLGKTMRLIVLGPGRIMRTRQLDSHIELADGQPPIKTSSLVYATSKKGLRGITTVLPLADAERVAKSNWLRISTLGSGPKSRRTIPTDNPIMSAEFDIGSTAALSRELAKCLADLQTHWGMVNGALPTPAVQPIVSLKGIFTSDDYPEDAMTADQGGATKFLLMIDEKGSLIDCVVTETSGVASIDGMGCQVMKERVKAKPALDAGGKPMKSIYETHVHWQIADR